MSAADARDRALIAQERVELAPLPLQDLGERGGVELERVRPEVGEIGVELLRRHEPDAGPFLLARLRQYELAAVGEAQAEHRRLGALRTRRRGSAGGPRS